MAIQVLMPALSPSMRAGRLTRWLIRPGDRIEVGCVMAEIETDTAIMEVEAVDSGRVERLLVAAGTDDVAVATPIATILVDGERNAQPTAAGRRVTASPLARRLAAEAGYDLAAIRGSGPAGRIVKRDVLAFSPRVAASAVSRSPEAEYLAPRAERRDAGAARSMQVARRTAAVVGGSSDNIAQLRPSPAPSADEEVRRLYAAGTYDVVPHDPMRAVIAERLSHSQRTVPHFHVRVDCRVDEVQRARRRMNGGPGGRGGEPLALTLNDFLIKAMALALQQVPAANVTWTEAAMLRHHACDIGVAVAVDGGVMTPVMRRADMKSLSEISTEMRDLAARARRRRLAPHEYQGGTCAISNLGMYGVREFDAVINPPHATILAVGAAEPRPVVVDGRLEVATVMSCSLSCDHRAVDGAVGAELLVAFKALIEDPLRMLV